MKRTIFAFFSLITLLSILVLSPAMALAQEEVDLTTSTIVIEGEITTPSVESIPEVIEEEIIGEEVAETEENSTSTEDVVDETEENSEESTEGEALEVEPSIASALSVYISPEDLLPPVINAPVCETNGLHGFYYNLPATHPDVELDIDGLTPGVTPFDHDWFDAQYLRFTQTDPITSLIQPADFFPVDDGLLGDPFYFAVHWTGYIYVPTSTSIEVALGSDDDAWFYLNGVEEISLAGVHAFGGVNQMVSFPAGTSTVDLYFAERKMSQSGIVFEVLSDQVTFSPCNDEIEENNPPVWTGATSTSVTVNAPINLVITPTDPDSDPLTITTNLPAGATYNTSTFTFSFTPNATGTFNTTFVANDGMATSTHELVITVTDAPCTVNCGGGGGGGGTTVGVPGSNPGGGGGSLNLPPYFVDFNPLTVAPVTQAYAYDVNGKDPENLPVTFSLNIAPAGMTINASSGVIFWIPGWNQLTGIPETVEIRISDGVLQATTSYKVLVTAPGSPTVPSGPPITVSPPIVTGPGPIVTPPSPGPSATTTIEEQPATTTAPAGGRTGGLALLAGVFNILDWLKDHYCLWGYLLWLLTVLAFLAYLLSKEDEDDKEPSVEELETVWPEHVSDPDSTDNS